jgi:hypothetical protein
MGRLTGKSRFWMAVLASFLLLLGPGCAAVRNRLSLSTKKNALTRNPTDAYSASVRRTPETGSGRSSSRPEARLHRLVAPGVALGVEGCRKDRIGGIQLPSRLTLGRTYLFAEPGSNSPWRVELGAGAALQGLSLDGASLDVSTGYSLRWVRSCLRITIFWFSPDWLAYSFTASAVFII